MILLGIDDLARREQARELLAWGAERYWGLAPLPELAAGERGKPWFPSCPQYHFNLSHSGCFALCALSDQPVGVDIQEMRAVWRPSLVERTCSPEERAWLSSLGDRGEDFAQLWALKESGASRRATVCPTRPAVRRCPCPRWENPTIPGRSIRWGRPNFGSIWGKNGGERSAVWRFRPRKSSG